MAAKARANALSLEVKKDALKQLQDGKWVISFRVHPDDMPLALMSAQMGTRYMAALVEIDQDDSPVEQKTTDKASKKRISLTKQAGALCGDPTFAEFLREVKRDDLLQLCDGEAPPADIPACVRLLCAVESRAEFDKDEAAGARWRDLHSEFVAWKINV